MTTSVIILGMGGHARVVADTCQASNRLIFGFTSPTAGTRTGDLFSAPYLGEDRAALEKYVSLDLVNGLGSVGPRSRRVEIYREWTAAGRRFATILHPSGIVAGTVRLGSGVQIMAGVVVQPGCEIAENAILNTRCSVDHDCVIGAHCHIAPGAVLSGGVELGEDVHVGTGAIVIQEIKIGNGAMIAAGAVVTRDVEPGSRVAGVPARNF